MITKQRELFLDNYIARRCKNAGAAAIDAGYSPHSAHVQASMLLKDPEMADLLEYKLNEMRAEMRKEFMFDAVQARKEMYKVMTNPNAKDVDKIAAAKDFLDRAGFKPTDNHDVTLNGVVIFEGMDDVED